MKRFLLLMLAVPLLGGGCSDDKTEDPGTTPPATTPAGTKEDPLLVGNLDGIDGKSEVWIKGYIVGAAAAVTTMSVGSDTRRAATSCWHRRPTSTVPKSAFA